MRHVLTEAQWQAKRKAQRIDRIICFVTIGIPCLALFGLSIAGIYMDWIH